MQRGNNTSCDRKAMILRLLFLGMSTTVLCNRSSLCCIAHSEQRRRVACELYILALKVRRIVCPAARQSAMCGGSKGKETYERPPRLVTVMFEHLPSGEQSSVATVELVPVPEMLYYPIKLFSWPSHGPGYQMS